MRTDFLPALGRATTRRAVILGGVGAAALLAAPGNAGRPRTARAETPWTGTWATAPTPATPELTPLPADCTVRQVVHLSLGGDEPRIRITNDYSADPVIIGEVWTGIRSGGPDSTAMWPSTVRPVTFDGRTHIVVEAGVSRVSDPVPNLVLATGEDLVISLHLPQRTLTGTLTSHAYQVNHVLTGNVAGAPAPGGGVAVTRWVLIDGVSVRTVGPSSAVVAFGDSITCGANSSVGNNRRWPDLLAARVRAAGRPLGVLNAGIGGNRLLTGPDIKVPGAGGAVGRTRVEADLSPDMGAAGLRRLDHDALSQPGVSHVITLIGVNDIGSGTGADALIGGYREMIGRSRAAGLTVIGGTILPFGGSWYDRDGHRAVRTTLNRWIRESGEFDAVVDFDAAIRDGAAPERMWAGYDCGDHLHPNDAGMLALASAVPLSLLS
ncbi:SGNH/GDSL hydrolase family protein [Actinoplanes sp. HUAS TT8]|uniref:SGNH/GDSL hydrolase family protein n=1 Tax=Actinoplanes sp. HUAS TT8 TaxID=3447453 RepID=UPI003F51B561